MDRLVGAGRSIDLQIYSMSVSLQQSVPFEKRFAEANKLLDGRELCGFISYVAIEWHAEIESFLSCDQSISHTLKFESSIQLSESYSILIYIGSQVEASAVGKTFDSEITID